MPLCCSSFFDMKRMALATLFWTLTFGDHLMPNAPRSCDKETCVERDFGGEGDLEWRQDPPPGVLPPERSELNSRFVDLRTLRSEPQFLRVLRDRQQNVHQFFRVLKRGDQFLRVLRFQQDRMPGEKTAGGMQRELRGQQQFFRVLKREKPLQRDSRAEAQFLRVLRSNPPDPEQEEEEY